MPYLSDILPEDPDATFDPAEDILEIIGDEQPGGGDTFALEAGDATLVYLIDWKKARSFIRWMIGFSYADEESPFKLRRENPQRHPRFPWLRAITVHFSAVAPTPNADTGAPLNTPNFPAVFVHEDIKKTGFYQKCYATVRFIDHPWDFRPDDFITSPAREVERNCYFDPVPVVDLLQAEGGQSQLKWAQGGGDQQPTVGDVFANLFATQVAKVTFHLRWMWVAENYLSNDSLMFFPEKILNCISKVNSVPFAGRPAGTMLMLAPTFQRFRFPISTFDGLFPFFGWNVSVPVVYFNPTLGIPDTDPTDNSIYRGHRTMPWRIDGLFYGAKREDATTTRYLLQETDINGMFEHIDAP